MGTSSWNSGDWARMGAAALIGGPVGAVAGYGLNTKRNTEAAARAARGQAETSAKEASAKEAQTQAAIAEDERLRRLRLLQGGSANAFEEATGRRTLLGQ